MQSGAILLRFIQLTSCSEDVSRCTNSPMAGRFLANTTSEGAAATVLILAWAPARTEASDWVFRQNPRGCLYTAANHSRSLSQI